MNELDFFDKENEIREEAHRKQMEEADCRIKVSIWLMATRVCYCIMAGVLLLEIMRISGKIWL